MKFSVITSVYNQLELIKRVVPRWEVQTFKDFEWILADDGSTDGLKDWLMENLSGKTIGATAVTVTTHEHDGYRLTKILNQAASIAKGDYLVWVMGDSYPKPDFLENLAKVATPDKILNGIRLNVDQEERIIAPDWRVDRVLFDLEADEIRIFQPRCWEYMTLNSMAISRERFNSLGGFFPGYDVGYGKMDWDLVANGYYKGMDCFWVPRSVIYHYAHLERDDTPNSTQTFDTRLAGFQQGSKRI